MLTIYDPSTKKEWEEYVKPTTYGNQNGLLYNRWVKQRQKWLKTIQWENRLRTCEEHG